VDVTAAGREGATTVPVIGDVTAAPLLAAKATARQQAADRLLPAPRDLGHGVIVVQDGRVVSVNAAYTTLTGYSTAELLTLDPDQLARTAVTPADHQTWRDLIGGAEGSPDSALIHLRRRGGGVVAVEVSGVTLDAADSSKRVLVVRDLTRPRQVQTGLAAHAAALDSANDDLTVARDAAIEGSRAKSAFLAAMSHEIRTPLMAVLALTDLLQDTDLDDDQRGLLDTVRTSGDTLLAVINDILDWSKIESGALHLENRPFELRACVESAATVVAAQGRDRNVDLLVDLLPGCPEVVIGDVTRLRQIIVNLAGNALKFTHTGHVLITAGQHPHTGQPTPQPSTDTAPTTSEPGGGAAVTVRITVADTGIGIEADAVGRLFRDFTQADDSTTRTYGGTGLGLAISRRLAQAMAGTVSVTSTPGIGSTFTVDVQLTTATATATAADASTGPPTPAVLAGRRVLVVDDDPVSQTILATQLRRWGMTADVAPGGAQALALLQEGHRYDVAVVDFRMPAMDGATLLARIARDHPDRPLPAVMVTSMSDRDALTGASHSPERVLTRPVQARVLRDALTDVLTGHSHENPERRRTPRARVGPAPASTRPVLVVDDNPDIRAVITRVLASLGYTADTAANGADALTAAEKYPYNIIFMDMNMPVMDGLETTRRLRQLPPRPTRPWVIALTGNAMVEDRDRCVAAGMDDFLPKPARRSDFTEALHRVPPTPSAHIDGTTRTRPATEQTTV